MLKDELGQGTGVFRKDCNTPVTCADLAIQAIVSMKLANVFPEVRVDLEGISFDFD